MIVLVRWQSVLSSTAPVIERYWDSLSSASQALFMQKLNSTWMTYHHAMPVKDAKKIFNLLVKGQLQVLQGDTITWNAANNAFSAKTSAGVLEVPYVIEATDQECHVDRIDVPIVRSAVARLQAHPVGGVQVDFKTLEASPGLFVMGSLTRGKHFYVSATDRVAAHSARVAKALTQDPFTTNFHVALFVGSDFFSHLITGQLVPQLLAAGYIPYVFVDKSSDSKSSLPELQNLDFIELLQQQVVSNLQSGDSPNSAGSTVRQMQSKYGILVQEVSDINSTSFVQGLATHHIDVGVSLQFGQVFQKEITQYFVEANEMLLLLDAGDSSSDRASATLMHAMKNKDRDSGYSLQQVIGTERSTRYLDVQKRPIDYSKPMLHCANDFCKLGVDMAATAVAKLARGEELGAMLPPTPPTGNAEFSDMLASKGKLDEYRDSEYYPVADAASVVQILVDSFANSKKKDAFQTHILGVVKDWLDTNHVQA